MSLDSATPAEWDALNHQVGGQHYHRMKIQPVTYIVENDIDYLSGTAIKYLSRHRHKGGAEDIRKAIQFCEFILASQYGEK